jgi:hypothetical protein
VESCLDIIYCMRSKRGLIEMRILKSRLGGYSLSSMNHLPVAFPDNAVRLQYVYQSHLKL